MSKNPQKKLSLKQKKQSVIDEQNQPCCRAIWKKIRNTNKKLAEITDLEKRDNLKTEQTDKISRKGGLLQEKKKYEEFLEFYKEVLTENAPQYKETQLKELNHLAEVIAIASYQKHSKTNNNNNNVGNLLTTLEAFNEKQTVQERTSQLMRALYAFANDQKVKNYASEQVKQQANSTYAPIHQPLKVQKNVEGPSVESSVKDSQKPKPKKSQKLQPPKVQKTQEVQQKKEDPIAHGIPQNQPKQSTQQALTEERVDKLVESNGQSGAVDTGKTGKTETNEQKKEGGEGGEGGERGEGGQRGERDGRDERDERDGRGARGTRGSRGYRGFRGEGRPGDQKPRYRAKYQPKDGQGGERKDNENDQDNNGESENNDDSPSVRQFHKQELTKLNNDGFIVVGKPKPKAQDQKQYYQHTHGQKYHHHHKQNY